MLTVTFDTRYKTSLNDVTYFFRTDYKEETKCRFGVIKAQ